MAGRRRFEVELGTDSVVLWTMRVTRDLVPQSGQRARWTLGCWEIHCQDVIRCPFKCRELEYDLGRECWPFWLKTVACPKN